MNNQITVVGYAGQAPTSVSFKDSDNKVVKFSVGVKEYSSKTEEDKTMWIDVDAWNGLGQRVLDTITKGREVVVTGRLAINHLTREVDGQTIEVHKPILKLSSFHLCGPKPASQEDKAESSTKRSRKSA